MEPEKQAREIQSQTEWENSEAYLIGRLLKEAREEKKLTISEVAIETRIRQIYIKALEDGALDQLPGEVYKIGFLKTYAGFLGLDVLEILRRLDLNQDVQLNYTHNKYVIPAEAQSQPSKTVFYLSITGALAFSIFAYVAHNSQDTVTSIENVIPENQELETVAVDELTSLTESSNFSPEEEGESSEEEGLSPHLASREKEPITTLEKTHEADSHISDSSNKKTDTKNTDTLPETGNQGTIILKAVKNTWVQVLDESGKTVYVRLMHAGDVYNVPSQGEYTLNTGNAGGLSVSYNGQETKLLGAEGQVMRNIRLTSSGLQGFY